MIIFEQFSSLFWVLQEVTFLRGNSCDSNLSSPNIEAVSGRKESTKWTRPMFFETFCVLVHWRFSPVFCLLAPGKALNDLLQRLKNLEGLDEEKSGLDGI